MVKPTTTIPLWSWAPRFLSKLLYVNSQSRHTVLRFFQWDILHVNPGYSTTGFTNLIRDIKVRDLNTIASGRD
ncbi:unnamed protein product [Clonostachys rosea]|uniref:Uncharacterized protein n=1 Tax=Bionectria ochroleuca TaxID=29856 RepID=A0ABY6U903_BIOOC|nr:unnamed protein product [Clonostachys rosea]